MTDETHDAARDGTTDDLGVPSTAPGTIVVREVQEEPRRGWVFTVTVAILLMLLLGLGAWFLVNLVDRNARLNDRVAVQDQTIDDLTDDLVASQENAQALYDQPLALGQDPEDQNPETLPVTGTQGPAGPEGPAGAPGPTCAEGTTPTTI